MCVCAYVCVSGIAGRRDFDRFIRSKQKRYLSCTDEQWSAADMEGAEEIKTIEVNRNVQR